jgi:hypothetical protein
MSNVWPDDPEDRVAKRSSLRNPGFRQRVGKAAINSGLVMTGIF